MSALTLFVLIFVFILVVGGWVSSEYISHKHSKNNKQLRQQVSKLERENNLLQNQLNSESDKFFKLKDDYEKVKDSKQQIRLLEEEYKALYNRYSNLNRGLDVLRKTVTSKKYLNNSLAKEITILLNEHLPDEKQIEVNKAESSRQAFKRIKDGMSGPT